MTKAADKILAVTDLSVAFTAAPVVSNLSFSAFKGSTIAIVGESGSGKSISSLAIMGLLPYIGAHRTGGSIRLYDKGTALELTALTEPELQKIRGDRIAMIFQEPMTSLDPVFSIGDQIIEALTLHRGLNYQTARQEAGQLLELVRIPNAKDQLDRYPHQLSGGMRQRVMIAMAASCNPDLLIADEPTTALDVTIQAQILQIIRDMQKELGTAVIFVTHDMGVVAEMADEILVMHSHHCSHCPIYPGTDGRRTKNRRYARQGGTRKIYHPGDSAALFRGSPINSHHRPQPAADLHSGIDHPLSTAFRILGTGTAPGTCGGKYQF